MKIHKLCEVWEWVIVKIASATNKERYVGKVEKYLEREITFILEGSRRAGEGLPLLWVRQTERERERERVVAEKERASAEREIVAAMRERELLLRGRLLLLWEREREREREIFSAMCVCVRERDRQRERCWLEREIVGALWERAAANRERYCLERGVWCC